MKVEVTADAPNAVGADLLAAGPARASELGAPERAVAEADPVAMVYAADAAPLAVVAHAPDADGLRTGAARAVRACRDGGTVAWALDPSLPLTVEEQVRALAEGAVIGDYDARRWRSGERPRGVERFVICGAGDELGPVAERAALVGRWTNVARELVDAPPNVVSPAGLAERAAAVPRVRTEIIDPAQAGLGALAAVGQSSAAAPLLIVLRHEPPGAPDAPRLALVGKSVTFDTRRLLPQDAGRHRPPEGRHGRRRRGRRGAGRDRRARAPAVGDGRPARLREHAERRARSGRRTSSRPPPA